MKLFLPYEDETLLLTTFCAFPILCTAQNSTDTITTRTLRNGNYRYYQGDLRLTETRLNKTIKTAPLSRKTMRAAQTNEVFGTVLAASGGALIGAPIGAYLSGAKMNWGIAGAGVALAVASFPLYNNAKKLKRKAINQYNDGLANRTSFLQRSEFNIGATHNGVGLTWSF